MLRMHAYTHARTHACVHARMHAHTYACTHVRGYIHVHTMWWPTRALPNIIILHFLYATRVCHCAMHEHMHFLVCFLICIPRNHVAWLASCQRMLFKILIDSIVQMFWSEYSVFNSHTIIIILYIQVPVWVIVAFKLEQWMPITLVWFGVWYSFFWCILNLCTAKNTPSILHPHQMLAVLTILVLL